MQPTFDTNQAAILQVVKKTKKNEKPILKAIEPKKRGRKPKAVNAMKVVTGEFTISFN
jgi:hypothetical protein